MRVDSVPVGSMSEVLSDEAFVAAAGAHSGAAKAAAQGSEQTPKDAKDETCRRGLLAPAVLEEEIAARSATCYPTGVDRFERTIATCDNARCLGDAMVRRGFAIAYLPGSAKYMEAEVEARRAKRGVWDGHFVTPAEWPPPGVVAMSRRPAPIAQADMQRTIRAANAEGVAELEIGIGREAVLIWRFQSTQSTDEDSPLVPYREFTL